MRYRIHVHVGPLGRDQANEIEDKFARAGVIADTGTETVYFTLHAVDRVDAYVAAVDTLRNVFSPFTALKPTRIQELS